MSINILSFYISSITYEKSELYKVKGPVRWGMLSTAWINSELAPGIRESSITKLVGVASRDSSRAEIAVKELGAEKAFKSYDDMLSSDEIDAVYVSVPNSLHAEWSIKAAEAGKHVLCEKPFASNAREAEEVVKSCNRNGVLIMEAFMYRHHPQHAKVKEIISSGRIGKPLIVNARFTSYYETFDDIRWKGELSGGALMDVGSYCINASRFIFESEPTAIKALWKYDNERGVDETTIALLEFPEEQYASIISSLFMQKTNKYEVIGTTGSIEVPKAFDPGTDDVILRIKDKSGTEEIIVPGVDQYRLEVEHFSNCILEGNSLKKPAENGLYNMRAIDAVREGVN